MAEAEPYKRESLAVYRRHYGDDHWRTHWALHSLGGVLRGLGKLEEAEARGAEAAQKGRSTWLDERPQAASVCRSAHRRAGSGKTGRHRR